MSMPSTRKTPARWKNTLQNLRNQNLKKKMRSDIEFSLHCRVYKGTAHFLIYTWQPKGTCDVTCYILQQY